MRGSLKSWTKLWCVLKPGLLLLYKNPKTKSSHWVGTILLTSCQVIERPSKKDGFCFKLFHPMEQSIWAPRGPDKESMGAVVQPLPTAYLIFRAPSQAAGKCWMDALELSLRCSALLLRSTSTSSQNNTPDATATTPRIISHETQWSEADYEKHFDEHGEFGFVVSIVILQKSLVTCMRCCGWNMDNEARMWIEVYSQMSSLKSYLNLKIVYKMTCLKSISLHCPWGSETVQQSLYYYLFDFVSIHPVLT